MSDGYPVNIRHFLGHLIGARVLDVTQHDKDEFEEDRRAFVELTFDNGARARFFCEEFVYDDAVGEGGETKVGLDD